MELFLVFVPKLTAALGAVIAAYPSLMAARIQNLVGRLRELQFEDSVLRNVNQRVAECLSNERDRAAANFKLISIGLGLTLFSLVADSALHIPMFD
jgi:hypothetical protein